ncbi:energy-coupling factor transport system ATP-binding protein [Hydrogenoanaerobacterium saccharovorans]|uniref:ABC transporter ATP-binding protein n=1 Tax=Hydrogenoanaerobacterium saccharovorans TaxID=474960 RepID=A0A1H8B0P9_9FIRM|nr:energy-coupling factor transporter ATPase [Hydrogenoanaerobacterium saccharovorans]RPF47655.1 energy-coupling factor transport system ATP-binding protein [Hydrogenoanaerobacterium saccharovorans]SEM76353.1 energy-coupling factor transport system ATP-binding protein [Hydrogenoanaerobacterium saccharovorans]
MEPIISAKNITFAYQSYDEKQSRTVLKDISLNIEKGSFVAVLGHNGSGKSTLAKHFNAILLPQGGTVMVEGIDTKDEDRIYDIRQRVGMVFQNPDNQIVATIVEEDVAFALENLGVSPSEIRQRVNDALKAVHMYEYREHAPHQLSGGQKQRVAIAGIIAMRPDCIVLDEPTAMLDPHGRRQVMKTIRMLGETYGITVVLITHYMDEAAKCDRVVVIDEGQIILDGTPKQVFSHVQILKEVGLDVPQATELVYELRKAGYNIPQDIISEEECIEALEKLMEENHVHH